MANLAWADGSLLRSARVRGVVLRACPREPQIVQVDVPGDIGDGEIIVCFRTELLEDGSRFRGYVVVNDSEPAERRLQFRQRRRGDEASGQRLIETVETDAKHRRALARILRAEIADHVE